MVAGAVVSGPSHFSQRFLSCQMIPAASGGGIVDLGQLSYAVASCLRSLYDWWPSHVVDSLELDT
jgi:hypothetical protein